MTSGSTRTTKCTACGADAVHNGVCGRCGYASGESNRCPHCGAVARLEPRAAATGKALSWVCAVCGGPRIPGGFGGEDAVTPLREAKALLASGTRARAAAIAWGIIALLATLVVAAASAHEAIAATLVLAVLAIVPAILALRARSRGGASRSAADAAESRAWLLAAEDVAGRARGGITVEELAKSLQIDPSRAEKLLSELAVHERTRIDVGDDAEVRYSVEPRLRVGDGDGEPDATEQEASADDDLRGSAS